MNNPLFQELFFYNAVHFRDYVERLSMFNPTIAQLRAQQMRVNEMKHLAAQDLYHGFAPRHAARKPLLAKIEEETALCYDLLRRSYEHSFRSASEITVADIVSQYCKDHPYIEVPTEPAIHHNIFREYYHKVVTQK